MQGCPQDIKSQDRDETEMVNLQDRDETQMFQKTSRDHLETETFKTETTSLESCMILNQVHTPGSTPSGCTKTRLQGRAQSMYDHASHTHFLCDLPVWRVQHSSSVGPVLQTNMKILSSTCLCGFESHLHHIGI